MNWYFLFFRFTGRITRSQFWGGLLTLVAVELIILWPLTQIFNVNLDKPPAPLWFRNINLLVDTLMAWPTLAIMIKRQRDRDQTGQLSWLLVATVIAYSTLDAFGLAQTTTGATFLGYGASIVSVGMLAVVFVELGARQGVEGMNRFGEAPVLQKE